MNGWTEAVCSMAAWIDAHITEPGTLTDMARDIGYSPTYCSTQFHRHMGMTLREYTMQRRLYHAAIAVRDSDARLIDIAMMYGYSSHEAMTAAFRHVYGVTPQEYRRSGRLIRLHVPALPKQKQGGDTMLTEPNIRVEYIPAHRYLGVFKESVMNGVPVWPRS